MVAAKARYQEAESSEQEISPPPLDSRNILCYLMQIVKSRYVNITIRCPVKKCIRVMKALSDPTRVKIVKVLGHKELCVCELTALLGLAQSTVSKHLKLLEDAGLVSSSREGAWVNYCLADGRDSPYAQAMLAHLGQWLDEDHEVRQILAEIPQVDRERIKVA